MLISMQILAKKQKILKEFLEITSKIKLILTLIVLIQQRIIIIMKITLKKIIKFY